MSQTGSATAEAAARIRQLAGKFLTFQLGSETYGLQILKVQEIIGIMPITRVPRTPDYLRGVINLRGKVIPVIELRRRFGMPGVDDTERTCIIVVQVETDDLPIVMGILVDEVSEVIDVSESSLEAPPTFGRGTNSSYILAMGKLEERVVILLDLDRVLTAKERVAIDTALAEK